MGQMNNFADGLDDVIERKVAALVNSAAEKKEQFVDEDFQKSWAEMGYKEQYDPKDFDRILVTSDEELALKSQFLKDAGIPFAESIIEGKYVIEIPKEVDQSQTSEYFRKAYTESVGGTETVTSASNNYSAEGAAERDRIQSELDLSAAQKERELAADAERAERRDNNNSSYTNSYEDNRNSSYDGNASDDIRNSTKPYGSTDGNLGFSESISDKLVKDVVDRNDVSGQNTPQYNTDTYSSDTDVNYSDSRDTGYNNDVNRNDNVGYDGDNNVGYDSDNNAGYNAQTNTQTNYSNTSVENTNSYAESLRVEEETSYKVEQVNQQYDRTNDVHNEQPSWAEREQREENQRNADLETDKTFERAATVASVATGLSQAEKTPEQIQREEDASKPSGLTGTVSSSAIFELMEQETGIVNEEYRGASKLKEPESNPYHTFRPEDSIISQLDVLGSAINAAERFAHTASMYGLTDTTFSGRNANRYSKEAIVINDTVIVDGKIRGSLSDEGIKEFGKKYTEVTNEISSIETKLKDTKKGTDEYKDAVQRLSVLNSEKLSLEKEGNLLGSVEASRDERLLKADKIEKNGLAAFRTSVATAEGSIGKVGAVFVHPFKKSRAVQARAASIREDIYGENVAQAYTLKGSDSIKSRNRLKNLEININNQLSIFIATAGVISGLETSDIDKVKDLAFHKAAANGIAVPKELKDALSKLEGKDPANMTFNFMERKQISEMMDKYANAIDKDIARLEVKMSKMGKNTDEYKNTLKKLNSLKVQKNEYIETSKKFALSEDDKRALGEAAKTIENLNKDFGKYGISIAAGKYLTRADLLKINEAFVKKASDLGYNVLKSNGMVDVKMLKKLTASDLQKLGISESSRKLLIDINSRGAVKGGDLDGLGHLMMSGFAKLEDSEDWAEFRRDMRTVKNLGKHSKNTVVNVKRFHKYMGDRRIEKLKAKGNDKWKELAKKKAEQAKKKEAKSFLKEGSPTSKLLEQNKELMAKKLRLQQKFEKSKLGRGMNFYKNTKKNLMEKGLNILRHPIKSIKGLGGFLKGVAAGGGSVFVKLGGFMVIFIMIITIIQAFLTGAFKFVDDLLAPEDYTETTGYLLYAYMDGQEDGWIKSIMEYDGVDNDEDDTTDYWVNKGDYKYGIDYQSFQAYLKEHFRNNFSSTDGGQLVYDESKDYLYINPFHQGGLASGYDSSGDVDFSNKSAMTLLDGYDGKHVYSFAANPNIYSKKKLSDDIETLTYIAAENGHTKNAKDILCMTDVMYQFSMQSMFNDDAEGGELYSILGKAPAQIWWEDFCNTIAGAFKWAGAKISSFFEGLFSDTTTVVPDFTIYVKYNGTVGYEAIQTYVGTLWQTSHQQMIALDVEYYPVGDVTFYDDGTPYKISTLSQSKSSEFDKCTSPVTKKYKIFRTPTTDTNGVRIAPYLVKEGTNTKTPLDVDGKYDIKLTMSDNCVEGNDQRCVWKSFGDNKTTKDKIDKYIENNPRVVGGINSVDPCWEKEDPEKVSTIYTNSYTSGWKKSLADAKADASSMVESEYNSHILSSSGYQGYYHNNDPYKFKYTYSEKPTFDPIYEYDSANDKRSVFDHYEYSYLYISGSNTVCETSRGTTSGWQNFSAFSGYKNSSTTTVHVNMSVTSHPKWSKHTSYTTANSYSDVGVFNWTDGDKSGFEVFLHSKTTPVYRNEYRVSAKAVCEEKYRQYYNRECNGHDFKYCGGHVCFHSQGIVYSITNEQLAASGAYEGDEIVPLAMNFDMKEEGYGNVKGKHNKDEIDYSTASTAHTTGMVNNPAIDVQGSYIGSKYGLELWIEGEEWVEGVDWEEEEEHRSEYVCVSEEFSGMSNHTRDIFDIDTAILKSATVLPIKDCDQHNFEGWTSDNIQIAAIKFAQDWYELYDFDIPIELSNRSKYLNYFYECEYDDETDAENDINDMGRRQAAYDLADSGKEEALHFYPEKDGQPKSGYTLTEDDIDKIVNELKKTYGSTLSEEREGVVRTALHWCGRGHYNPYHTDHNFLESYCSSNSKVKLKVNGSSKTYYVKYNYNCTASTSMGFAKFVYARMGYNSKKGWTSDNASIYTGQTSAILDSNGDLNALPADVIQHFGKYKENGEPNMAAADIHGGDVQKFYSEGGIELIRQSVTDNAVIYLGKTKDDITLDSHRNIGAGSILTVELNSKKGGIGNIWLNSTDVDSDGFLVRSIADNPYWVTHPDIRTYVRGLF